MLSLSSHVRYVASWYTGELCQLTIGHTAVGVLYIFIMACRWGISGFML
jgi:hypothetical protein